MQLTLIAIALAAFVGFGTGWKVNSWKEDAAKTEAIRAATAAKEAAEFRANEISTRFEARLSTIRAVNRTYYNEVKNETLKTVYTDCVVPDSGRMLYNRAIDTANHPAKPDNAVPATGPSTGAAKADDGGTAQSSDGFSGTLRRMFSPASGSGGSSSPTK